MNPLGVWGYVIAGIAFLAMLYGLVFWVDTHWATSAGVKKGKAEVQAKWDEAKTQQREAEIEQARAASVNLGGDRAKNDTVYRTITKYVDKVVDRPVYRNVCMDDDGLRYVNCLVRSEAGTASCGPEPTVPSAGGVGGQGRSDGTQVDGVRGQNVQRLR